MPDRAYLHPIDPELLPGARNAIDTCLRLKPQERITIITDTVTRDIAAALQSEVERVGSEYSLFVLEHHARRPLSYMPEIILDDLALSQVSIFAAQSQPGELGCAHRDDQRGKPSPDPARAHGEHQSPDHARRHARRFLRSRQAQPAFGRTCASGRSHHLQNAARHRVRRRSFRRNSSGSKPAASSLATNGATFPGAKFSPRR